MSTTFARADQPVITAWSALSPFGDGRTAFEEGLLAGRPTDVPVDRERWRGADERACLVPGFDIREALGPKGTRAMDRVTGLAVTAAGRLLGDVAVETGEHTGFVLGTTIGSAQSMMSFTEASLTGAQPYHVEPATIPNSVMNCAAGRCAIWYDLKGPNATIAAGRASGLLALIYTRRLLLTRRARRVLCGAAEEYSGARSWLEHHGRGGTPAVLAEGCAVFLVEPAATARRPALATLLAVDSRLCPGGEVGTGLRESVRHTLKRAGAEADEVWAATASTAAGPYGAAERAALAELFDERVTGRIPVTGLAGDAGAVSASFHLAATLTVAGRDARAAGRLAVITAADRDGTVASALLRLEGGPDER